MTATRTPPRLTKEPRREGFGPVLRSEWTKFRTVRGWVIGLIVAAVLCVVFTFLTANGSHTGSCTGPPPPGAGPNSPGSNCQAGHPFVPTGPNGQAVADSYYLVDQPLTGNGSITARVTSLTGLTSTQPVNVAPSSGRGREPLERRVAEPGHDVGLDVLAVHGQSVAPQPDGHGRQPTVD